MRSNKLWLKGIVGACLLWAGTALALTARIERISAPAWRVDGVRIGLQRNAQSGVDLDLQIGSLHWADWTYSRLRWRCPLQLVFEPWLLRCDGKLMLNGAELGRLEWTWGESMDLVWRRGAGELSIRADSNRAGSNRAGINPALAFSARQFPLDSLAQLLPAQIARSGGRLSADLTWTREAVPIGTIRVEAGQYDAVDGRSALAGLDLRARLQPPPAKQAGVDIEAQIDAGQVLLGAWYVELAPGTLVSAVLRDAGLDLHSLRVVDGAALELKVRPEPGVAAPWSLSLRSQDAEQLYQRYLAAGCAVLGVPALRANGDLQLDASLSGSQPSALQLHTRRLDLTLANTAFGVRGLRGDLTWTLAEDARLSRIGWSSAFWKNLQFGAAEWSIRSAAGALALVDPVRLAVADGSLQVDQLHWQSAADSPLRFAATAQGLALAPITTALGWPPFEGSLSARIPTSTWSGGNLDIAGAIDAEVFGGRVRIDGLAIERAFGVAPGFSADVDLTQIDLAPLTRVFGFGEIEGHVDGRIKGLRVLGGQPVAFDAQIASVAKESGRRRISQRAVGDLSRIGGGSGGLESTALRLFDSFAYKRIGLSCRLQDNVCTMGGVAGLDQGARFVLLEGAGLPRVDIAGFQRRVNWPVLVSRLRAAASGGGVRLSQPETAR